MSRRKLFWVARFATFLLAAMWLGERLPSKPRTTVNASNRLSIGFSAKSRSFLTIDEAGKGEHAKNHGPLRFWDPITGEETGCWFENGELGSSSAWIELSTDGRRLRLGPSLRGEEGKEFDLTGDVAKSVNAPLDRQGESAPWRRGHRPAPNVRRFQRGYQIWSGEGSKSQESLAPASGSWSTGSVSSDDRTALLIKRSHELILWDLAKSRQIARIDFQPQLVRRAVLAPDGERAAAELTDGPEKDTAQAGRIEAIRWRDCKRSSIDVRGEASGFVSEDRLIVILPRRECDEDTEAELWTTDDGRRLARWRVGAGKMFGFAEPSGRFRELVMTAPDASWALLMPRLENASAKRGWLEKSAVGRILPDWLVGEIAFEALDARNGVIPATSARMGGREWSADNDKATLVQSATLSPDGRFVALLDRSSGADS